MWTFLRWFKPKVPPTVAESAPLYAPVSEVEDDLPVPAEAVGLERLKSRSHPSSYYYRNEMPAPLPDLPLIMGDGLFTYHLAGAAHYQDTLERIVGGRREASVYFRVNAVLSSEPDDPHNSNAVVIRIDGEKAGHVRKQDNLTLRHQLDALGFPGDVQCRAEIAGGWDHGRGDVGMFGLRLDLTFPLDVRSAPNTLAPNRKKKR